MRGSRESGWGVEDLVWRPRTWIWPNTRTNDGGGATARESRGERSGHSGKEPKTSARRSRFGSSAVQEATQGDGGEEREGEQRA